MVKYVRKLLHISRQSLAPATLNYDCWVLLDFEISTVLAEKLWNPEHDTSTSSRQYELDLTIMLSLRPCISSAIISVL